MTGRLLNSLALLLLLAALGGCETMPTSVGAGGPVVAGHLGYVKNFMEAGAQERARMVQALEERPDTDNAQARLRYAIVLSLHGDDPKHLAQSLEFLQELQADDGLAPAERWLAGLWHSEVASRLDLKRENADFRVALDQAQKKLDQLTQIEEQLEAQDSNSEEQ